MRKCSKRWSMQGGPMAQCEFREAAEMDIPKIITLLKETIVEVYGQILAEDILGPWVEGDQLNNDVNNSWQNMIVAERAGKIVAVAARFNEMIGLIWVHPAHQREGIGSVLLNIVETEIKESGYGMAKLACFSDNDRALSFYLDKGWKVLCEEKDEDAGALKIVMTKTLISGS